MTQKKKTQKEVTTKDIIRLFKKDNEKTWWYRFYKRFKRLIIGFIVLVLSLNIAYAVAYRLSTETITFTVNKEPIRMLQDSAYSNLIYTDKGVYTNEDSLVFLKFRSSDVYNQLKEGQTYTCEVAGWRVGFFDTYKNIIDCEGLVYH